MELRQLRYFCAVADEGNLTRAAEALGLRSPSLSQQIRALEQDLRARLFDRSATGMALTAAGEALLPEARAALAAAGRARRAVQQASAPVRTYTVGLPAGVPAHLPGLIRAAARALGAEVAFEDVPTGRQLPRLRHRDLDLGIVTMPLHHETEPRTEQDAEPDAEQGFEQVSAQPGGQGGERAGGLAVRVVHREPLGVLMAADHPLAAADRVAWTQLHDQDLLFFPRDLAPGYHDALLAACRGAGWRPRLRISTARRAVTRAELTGGEPVVALRPAAEAEPGLAWRPLASAAPAAEFALAWPGRAAHPLLPGILRELRR
ncbi:LysR family transcriptional regulator [Actinomadura rupiterrae]|uniref:LysR family transcriptional regulator n=1 Tax=Actinomadura rupiterrae TaxID=559627 RepID=UPI0020A3E2E0|nr:LysR family transcriptional regulator [Actinomadura rupiterrae]MCP2343516.1 DNA-binding transcriptional LysR family regulator [Actinomadura rupiterrae]